MNLHNNNLQTIGCVIEIIYLKITITSFLCFLFSIRKYEILKEGVCVSFTKLCCFTKRIGEKFFLIYLHLIPKLDS